jgi:hypothetical protein
MASIRDVMAAYAPELDLGDPVPLEEALIFLKEKSALEPDTIQAVLNAYAELAHWYLLRGRPVPLPGIGHLIPTVDYDGVFGAAVQTDSAFSQKMGGPDNYRGGINRRENIGVSRKRLAQMWNSSHPDDRIDSRSL